MLTGSTIASENFAGITYGAAGIAVAIAVLAKLSRPKVNKSLAAIPTAHEPRSGWLGSWLDSFTYLANSTDIIQEGYEKYKSMPFKILHRYRWMVVVSNRKHIDELLKAPEEELSFVEAANDRFNARYTLGCEVHDNPIHVAVIRSQLTRNIGTLYSGIRDEIVTSFDEILDLKNDEWKAVPALNVIQRIVCRTSNRLFVGLPLCRDPDWIDLNIQYTTDIITAGVSLGMFPKFIRPLAVYFFKGVSKGIKRGLKHLGPIIKERQECGSEIAETPNDVVSWLMDEAGSSPFPPEILTRHVLTVNFTAIHSSSNTFTHALLYLAANPQYIKPLRDEVEAIIEVEGWSKASLVKMRKVDSFMMECQRLEGMSALGIVRKAMKDFTFSDGTFLPKGTLVGVANRAVHYEEKLYEDPKEFKPFRFADMDGEDEEGRKYQFVRTSLKYLLFGHGKHACPGRFFAANELKSILAHIVVTYDIKLEDNMGRPRSVHFGSSIVADPRAKVLFKKRIE